MSTSFLLSITRCCLLSIALAAPCLSQALPSPDDASKSAAPNPILLPDSVGSSAPIVYDWAGKPKAPDRVDGSAPDAAGNGDSPSDHASEQKSLPYFLYDFFAPARQIIEARHAAMKRFYEQSGTPAGAPPAAMINSVPSIACETPAPDHATDAKSRSRTSCRGWCVRGASAGAFGKQCGGAFGASGGDGAQDQRGNAFGARLGNEVCASIFVWNMAGAGPRSAGSLPPNAPDPDTLNHLQLS
jgi:hypothetical protein